MNASFSSLRQCAIVLFSMAILMACQMGKANPPNDSNRLQKPKDTLETLSMNKDLIQLELTAQPLQLSMSERKNFKISLKAINRGHEVIDPELHYVQLFINDEESMAWNLAIGNGRREAKWAALPPGDTVSMTWSSLGQSFFPIPGNYTLVPHYGTRQLDPIQIHVTSE